MSTSKSIAQTITHSNLLIDAIIKSDIKKVRAILKYVERENSAARYVNLESSSHQSTPLTYAATLGNTEIVAMLLAAKADPNKRPSEGSSEIRAPLTCAMVNRHIDIIKLLIDAKANPNARNVMGYTLLAYAARELPLNVTQQLLDAKADPNAKSEMGETPLLRAVDGETTNVAIIIQLLIAKAKPDIPDCDGLTALALAQSSKDKKDIAKLLSTDISTLQMRALALGTHKRAGLKSAVLETTRRSTYDRQLLRVIHKMIADKPKAAKPALSSSNAFFSYSSTTAPAADIPQQRNPKRQRSSEGAWSDSDNSPSSYIPTDGPKPRSPGHNWESD